LASRKEIEYAIEGKEKVYMTRAKSIKSFFRMVTVDLNILDIPMIIINHTYKDQAAPNPKYAGDIIGGCQGSMLNPNYVWIVKRKKEKDNGGECVGYEFNIKIEKGRGVKEESKIPITVYWKDGIHKYSGLSELALEFGIIEKCKVGRKGGYKYKDFEIELDLEDTDDEFWTEVLQNSDLAQKIHEKYSG
jgi:hypothetical protein